MLECIGEHPINRIDELLPSNVADKLASATTTGENSATIAERVALHA